MTNRAVRQLLQRLQRRLDDLESLLGRSKSLEFADSAISRSAPDDRLASIQSQLVEGRRDCGRALSLVASTLREPSETECVRSQLLDAVRIRARCLAAVHPWGLTTDVEPLVEVELESDTVSIPVETDGLPHSLRAVWREGDVPLELAFELRRIVESERRGKEAIYRVELVEPAGREPLAVCSANQSNWEQRT